MAYCTAADVQKLVTQMTFDDATPTKPALADITSWIADITEEMNGVLATADYDTDITATASAKILNLLCRNAVASLAIQAAQFGSEPVMSDQADRYWEVYQEGLKKIRTYPNYLHDAASDDVGGGARLRSYQDDAGDDAPDPEFTREMSW